MGQQQRSSENFYCNVETIWHISKTGRNSQDERAFLPVFHSLRLGNFDLLRADCFAASASDAGARLFVFRNGTQCHRRNESAACEAVLIVETQQVRDIQSLWTVADTIMACGTRKCAVQHSVCHTQQLIHLFVGEGFFCLKGADIILKLFHVGHTGQGSLPE